MHTRHVLYHPAHKPKTVMWKWEYSLICVYSVFSKLLPYFEMSLYDHEFGTALTHVYIILSMSVSLLILLQAIEHTSISIYSLSYCVSLCLLCLL